MNDPNGINNTKNDKPSTRGPESHGHTEDGVPPDETDRLVRGFYLTAAVGAPPRVARAVTAPTTTDDEQAPTVESSPDADSSPDE